MIAKIKALWALFQKGQAVADPALWKKRQITANVLGGVIYALVQSSAAFGLEIPVSNADIDSIAAGVLVIVNVALTITTTDKIGLPPKR